MKFERESWRKLYVAESAEHRLLPLFARGLRDYLLRLAGEDGTILASTDEPKRALHKLLGAEKTERPFIDSAFDDLIRVGYLSFNAKRLWITKFEDAQAARSPGAIRQAKYKDEKRKRDELARQSADTSPKTSPYASPKASAGDAPVTSQIDETRRDETRTPTPAAVTVVERAQRVLANPHDGQFEHPSGWPEVLEICESWSFGMRIKLRDFPDSDSDLRAILEGIAAEEFTIPQLVSAGALAKKSPYFAKLAKPGPASFTAPVLRRLLGGDANQAKTTFELPKGVQFG